MVGLFSSFHACFEIGLLTFGAWSLPQGYLHAVPQASSNHQTIAFPCQLRDDAELDSDRDLSRWRQIIAEQFALANRSRSAAGDQLNGQQSNLIVESSVDSAAIGAAAPAGGESTADQTPLVLPQSEGAYADRDRLLRVRRQVSSRVCAFCPRCGFPSSWL